MKSAMNAARFDSQFTRKRRKKRVFLVIAVVLFSAAVTSFFIFQASQRKKPSEAIISKAQMLKAWGVQDYLAVRNSAVAYLVKNPVDPYFLAFHGLSSYYAAMDMTEGQERSTMLDEAVRSIRRALLKQTALSRSTLLYILGKAYFEKGTWYIDESLKYLLWAKTEGSKMRDIDEYIALAYSQMGDNVSAVTAFESALKNNPSDVIMVAAAKVMAKSNRLPQAKELLQKVSSTSKDAIIRENALLAMGDILRENGEISAAIESYKAILATNADSAAAHFKLGLAYLESNEALKARAEWRKTLEIDPMFVQARQKLAERL